MVKVEFFLSKEDLDKLNKENFFVSGALSPNNTTWLIMDEVNVRFTNNGFFEVVFPNMDVPIVEKERLYKAVVDVVYKGAVEVNKRYLERLKIEKEERLAKEKEQSKKENALLEKLEKMASKEKPVEKEKAEEKPKADKKTEKRKKSMGTYYLKKGDNVEYGEIESLSDLDDRLSRFFKSKTYTEKEDEKLDKSPFKELNSFFEEVGKAKGKRWWVDED